MSDKLNLTVPIRKGRNEKSLGLVVFLLCLLLVIGSANLIFTIYAPVTGKFPLSAQTTSFESLKELAFKLEKQGLRHNAASAWKEYLSGAGIESKERAKIWYRIGKLYQEGGKNESALEAYYRSESVAKISELESDINRRTQEALESLGKFAALRYELEDRVSLNNNKTGSGGEVLAEIGANKITKSEMDRRIEEMIEQQLSPMKSYLSGEQLKSRKGEMLKRFASGQERTRLLNQLILEEILSRKGREDKLFDDSSVRRMIKDAEKSILAQQVLERELESEVKITPGDLQTYYDARKQEFVQPEEALIGHILVADEKAADRILIDLEKGGDFGDLAKKHSLDKETGGKGGKIESSVTRGRFIPGIGNSEEATGLIFSTPAGGVVKKGVKTEKGVHIIKVLERKEKVQKPFEEAKQDVYLSLRRQKDQEVREALIGRLRERYKVVIHSSLIE